MSFTIPEQSVSVGTVAVVHGSACTAVLRTRF